MIVLYNIPWTKNQLHIFHISAGSKSGEGGGGATGSTSGGGTITTTSASVSGHVNKFIQQVALKYCDESKKHFDELSKSMQVSVNAAIPSAQKF